MRVSDYIVSYLQEKGIHAVFGYPGGMVTYLMDSLYKTPEIKNCLLYHEQGASFAACGYGQLLGTPTVAYATSGPGATNLVTGIANAWFDSIPAVFITGQVNTSEAKTTEQVRQKGFQETDIVDIVRSITKYAVQITDASRIQYELEKAFFLAQDGRMGPVLLDLPIDIMRKDVDPGQMARFCPQCQEYDDPEESAGRLLSLLASAQRPCLLLGNGAHHVPGETIAAFIRRFDLPYVTSMPAVDLGALVPENYYGFLGAYGARVANQIMGRSTLLISMGSRLDIRQTGFDSGMFASNATIFRIDVDSGELDNQIHADELRCHRDLNSTVRYLLDHPYRPGAHTIWKNQCAKAKELLSGFDRLEPNAVVEHFSTLVPDRAVITTDVGQNQVWVAQSFQVKPGQRILFSSGHGAMGYSLPAAIGAYYAGKSPVIAFCGDGGLQMNIQEMQVLSRERLPVKIVLLNNYSLGMIRHFQEMYFQGSYAYTVGSGGYTTPDFLAVASAYGVRALRYDAQQDDAVRGILQDDEPALIEIALPFDTYVSPKGIYNAPLSFQSPELPSRVQEQIDRVFDAGA